MSQPLTPVKRFFKLLQVDKQEILSIYIYAVFNGMVALSLPLGIQAIINLITGGQVSTAWIILVVFVIAGVGLSGVMQIMQLTISENLQRKIFTRSAFEFAYRIPRLKLEALDKAYTPELVNRFFDTLSVQKGLSKILIDFSSASLQMIFGLILLSLYHPFFILFSLVLVGAVYLLFRLTAPRGLRTSLQESAQKYRVAHWLEEVARAMETFKLAGKSPLPMKKTDEAVEGYLAARKEHFRTLIIQFINLAGFKVIIAAGLLLIGGLLVINQQMNIGQFVASEIIIILVIASVEKLILSMETIYDVLTAIEKIGAVTDIPLERDKGTTPDLENEDGMALRLKDLSYQFSGTRENTLNHLDLKIEPGQKVLLAGFSGSGKTVLLQIMAGLFEDFSGTLSYNGSPLRSWCKEELWSVIGDSLTYEDIFKGTLEENIALGKEDIPLRQVRKAAAIVGLTDFVESLPEGYNTVLVPEGRNLPKSVRLKIMLARSLTGNFKLLLLEDNFNQLQDTDKTRFLDHILAEDRTVVAVSSDPNVAQRFDRILALDGGKVIGDAPPKEAERTDWYCQIFQTSPIC